MIADLIERVMSVSYRVWLALAVDPIASAAWLACGLLMLGAATAGWYGLCRLDRAFARRRRRRRVERSRAMGRHPSAQSRRLRRPRALEPVAVCRSENRSEGINNQHVPRTSDPNRTERTP